MTKKKKEALKKECMEMVMATGGDKQVAIDAFNKLAKKDVKVHWFDSPNAMTDAVISGFRKNKYTIEDDKNVDSVINRCGPIPALKKIVKLYFSFLDETMNNHCNELNTDMSTLAANPIGVTKSMEKFREARDKDKTKSDISTFNRLVLVLVFAQEILLEDGKDAVLTREEIQLMKDLFGNITALRPTNRRCFYLVARPKVQAIDSSDNNRLHSDENASEAYEDGEAYYHWKGLEVAMDLIMEPQKITIERIDDERNAEIRRVMIDRMGAERYIQDSGAKMVQKDKYGELYVKEREGDDPVKVVKVKNDTQEPDGSFKYYFLRVPPETTTAHEGVAWTFKKTKEEYNPIVES